MNTRENVLARVSPENFAGRGSELAELIAHASNRGTLDLHAAPKAGSSELLLQVYDHFFHTASEIIPFYFRVRADEDARAAARRFVREFVTQTAAFDRRMPDLIAARPETRELVGIVSDRHRSWVESAAALADSNADLESLIAVPFRAVANGARVFVLIDEFDRAADQEFRRAMRRVFSRPEIPNVFCFRRRFQPGNEPAARLHLSPLSEKDACAIFSQRASEKRVLISEEVCDLAVLETCARPQYLLRMVDAAAAKGVSLVRASDLASIYTDEVFGIGIGHELHRELSQIVEGRGDDQRLFGALLEAREQGGVDIDAFKAALDASPENAERILNELHISEFVTIAAGRVYVAAGDVVFNDYLTARHELRTGDKTRARVFSETLSCVARRGPRTLARHYRKSSALGLRDLLANFAGGSIALASIDHERFDAELKGRDEDEQLAHIAVTHERFTLPRILFSVNAADIYPPIAKIADVERTAIAFGIDAAGKETAWIAAEFDSKLAASLDLTEYWLDRLEMASISSGISDHRVWLITREGFSPEAMRAIKERGGLGSSLRQIELIRTELKLSPAKPKDAANKFEITIPMGGDAEIVAASFAEDIAERQGFSQRAINQIKTALVEACINASEHSLSPDRKIHLTFFPHADRLEIIVKNRGIRLADRPQASESAAGSVQRRGWGLELIAKLSDSVESLPTDDGTILRIVKLLS